MSAPSRSGWHGWPVELRVCAGCGARLTLKDAPLWFDEMHRKVWHFDHHPLVAK